MADLNAVERMCATLGKSLFENIIRCYRKSLGLRGDYMKVLSVKIQHAVAMLFPAFYDLTS